MIDPKINLRSKSAISAPVNNNAGIAIAWLNLGSWQNANCFRGNSTSALNSARDDPANRLN